MALPMAPIDRVVAPAAGGIDLGQPGKDPVFGRGLIQLADPCGQQTQ